MPPSAKNTSVFVVDDRPEIVKALQQMFVDAGLLWSGSLPSADGLVEAVRGHCPTIVVLDISMPGKDAYAVLSELADACPDSRVVVFTSVAERATVYRAITAGAWGFVFKDDGPTALLQVTQIVAEGGFALSEGAKSIAHLEQ